MHRTEHRTAVLPAADYIRDYRDAGRFIECCRACGNYGKMWVCPPYEFDILDRIGSYRYAHITGTMVFIDDETRYGPCDGKELAGLTYEIIGSVRRELDGRLLGLERKYPGSMAFFAGSCYLCGKGGCTREFKKECVYPDRARPSLEAYGFDISKTASELLGIELKWSEGTVLPEYFTLVGGLFSDRETRCSEI